MFIWNKLKLYLKEHSFGRIKLQYIYKWVDYRPGIDNYKIIIFNWVVIHYIIYFIHIAYLKSRESFITPCEFQVVSHARRWYLDKDQINPSVILVRIFLVRDENRILCYRVEMKVLKSLDQSWSSSLVIVLVLKVK